MASGHPTIWINKQKTALIVSWILLFIVIVIGLFLLTDPQYNSASSTRSIKEDVLAATVKAQKGSTQLESFDPPISPSVTLSPTAFPTAKLTPTTTIPTPTPLPAAENIKNLRELFKEVESKVFVPAAILEAVGKIEMLRTFEYSSEQIFQYATPGNTIPGCGPNVCSATGPMQMTTGIDRNGSSSCSQCCWKGKCLSQCPNAWSGYKNAVVEYGGYTHSPNVCNLRDNIYGAASKLKNDSGTEKTSLDWTREQVNEAGYRYYGNNTTRYARLNDMTYGEYVWWYYENYEY